MVMTRPPMPEPLSETDRIIIGNHVRIKIPLENKMLLRDVADALRGLAQVMDIQSRLTETSEREALIRIRHEVRHSNCLIRDACKRYDVELRDGRPTDAARAEKAGLTQDSVETWETVSAATPLHLAKVGSR